ncbi:MULTISPECIES: hypothetical protein [Corallincola]|uniref:Uncharacterized protein n=2 Tax=Corallincola TaxID=1775176 RepID=A0A368N2R8_9GAMM|nr:MULTISPECIES: hypothetical protein [Corallincola]RCU43821.1 hypothetical protein DU002_18240 [Corallincola holothuriorum]TAA46931.1 hypothetical protein EXY25_06650 [Corallincola spongiicola]
MEPVNANVAASVTQQLPPQSNNAQQTALASISEVVAAPPSSETTEEDATESVQVSNSLGQAAEASNLTRSRAIELYRAVAALV